MRLKLIVLTLTITLNITFASECHCQNLVPNPSFEDFNNCPAGVSEIDYSPTYSQFTTVKSWINPLHTSTPDYFNACAPDPNTVQFSVAVPYNFQGFQSAHTGVGYVGIVPYSGIWGFNYSEYIECQLLHSLIAGHKYDVAFYVSYTYKTIQDPSKNMIAVKRLGLHFSDTLLYHQGFPTGDQVLNIPFHIENAGGYITDTVNWYKISGVYTAHGGERFLTIGTFNDGHPVATTQIFPIPATVSPVTQNYSYYFIDDVSVIDQIKCDTIIKLHDSVACSLEPFNFLLKPGYNGMSYYWSNSATTPDIVVNKEGRFWRNALSGCNLYVDTFIIRQSKSEKTSVRDTVVCYPKGVVLNGIGKGLQYLWNTGDTTTNITIQHNGTYSRKTIEENSCVLLNEVINVSQKVFDLKFDLGDDTIICREDNFILGENQNGLLYKWNTGEEVCCIRPSTSGVYKLTKINECYSFSDSINIEVEACNDCFFIPSAFTPNADGKNDFFSVFHKCQIKSYSLRIFSRWGELIFHSNHKDDKWNGLYKGEPMPMGTYFYYIEYSQAANKPFQQIKGDVTLVR